jgi:hypothetical protein
VAPHAFTPLRHPLPTPSCSFCAFLRLPIFLLLFFPPLTAAELPPALARLLLFTYEDPDGTSRQADIYQKLDLPPAFRLQCPPKESKQ